MNFELRFRVFFYVFVDIFYVFLQKTRFLQRKAKIFNPTLHGGGHGVPPLFFDFE